MAITTYAELQTAIADWMDVSNLVSKIPTFIDLAEARFARTIRHYEMEKRATKDTVAGERAVSLPSDYIEIRNIKINSSSVDSLEFLPPALLYENSTGTGTTKYYTIQGKNLLLEPIPDSAVELEINYYGFDQLDDTNTTNWLLTRYPDIYLYGSLVQSESFVMNDERIFIWKMALDEALKELERDDRNARWNGSPLTIRGY